MAFQCDRSTKYIRMDEVRKHTSAGSTWFVIHDVVYDVTPFLEQHPGGSDALLESAGRDSTQAFEDVGHSDGAREDMKKYKIGVLHPDDRAKKSKEIKTQTSPDRTISPDDDNRTETSPESTISPDDDHSLELHYLALGIAAVATGLVIGFVLKRYVL